MNIAKGGMDTWKFGNYLRRFISDKVLAIFLLVFVVLNSFLLLQYTEVLKTFALQEKNFTVKDVIAKQFQAEDLLSQEFTCETVQPISGCDNYFIC